MSKFVRVGNEDINLEHVTRIAYDDHSNGELTARLYGLRNFPQPDPVVGYAPDEVRGLMYLGSLRGLPARQLRAFMASTSFHGERYLKDSSNASVQRQGQAS